MTSRLKPREVAAYRKRLLAKQHGLCALCKLPIEPGQDTLDHDHAPDSGHCRGVLHRACNAAEGRILKWAKTAPCSPSEFLEALVHYWAQDYSHYAVHPNHRTASEREIAKLKRRMKKLKTARGRQRYLDRIKALEDGE